MMQLLQKQIDSNNGLILKIKQMQMLTNALKSKLIKATYQSKYQTSQGKKAFSVNGFSKIKI